MRNLDQGTITEAVLARHGKAENPRLKYIMSSLVRHLHAFAREVELTEEETATVQRSQASRSVRGPVCRCRDSSSAAPGVGTAARRS